MLPKPELAYFAIADISGYTSFLAGVELDHAQDITADLMDTVVKGLRPPFRLAKFEGDAAFVYAATAKVDGSMLQDIIEFGLFQVPPAPTRHQAGLGLRVQGLRGDGRSRSQVCWRALVLLLHFTAMPASRRWASTRRRKDSSSITKPSTAPRQTVWEYFTVPGQRQKWWPADGIIENSSNKRRGVGTENHCMHGKDAIVEEVLDWRPFDYFTVSTLLPIPGAPKIILTHAFQDWINGVTHIEMRVAKPKPEDEAFVDQAGSKFKENITKAIGDLRLMLEGQQTSTAVIAEPPLIPSSASGS